MARNFNSKAIVKPLSALVLISAILFFLVNRDEMQREIISSLKNTFTGVIPALFPFMVISKLFILWGCSDIRINFLGRIFENLFHVPQEAAGPFFIGLVSSYPLGGSAVCELYKSGKYDKRRAERMLALCNNTGPGFILGFVGGVLWKDISFGIAIYVIHIASVILAGALRYRKKNTIEKYEDLERNSKNSSISIADIAEAIASAAESAVKLAGFIAFFSMFSGYIENKFTALPYVSAIVSVLLEFSGGCVSSARVGGIVGAALTGFAISFGGLSVISQTMLYARSAGLSVAECVKLKLLEGIAAAFLSAAYAKIFFDASPDGSEVFIQAWISSSLPSKSSLTITAAVLVLCFIYIIFKKFRRNDTSVKHYS